MNRETRYQAARVVAPAIEQHFAELTTANQHREHIVTSTPDETAIEAIVDVAFWASLRREEGHSPQISLAFLPPEQAFQPMLFEQKLALTPSSLTKLGPAVERPGIHLGVWGQGDDLYVWGATRQIPSLCFVLEVIEPGLLVIKHRGQDSFGKFVNVAVLKGDEVKIIDEQSASLPDCPAVLTSLLGFTTPTTWNGSVDVLVQLAASMRAHKRGGSLLVVPHGTQTWRDSIIHPISYAIQPAFDGLSAILKQEEQEQGSSYWQAKLRQAVEGVAGVTAVDGATIISDQYELLAFGAKIRRPPDKPPVEQIIVTEPILGAEPLIIHPAQNGGTRHLSAAQFVYDQRDAHALVASQDGRFTIFSWSPCEGMVHAHRVDSLLL
ncbi:hypothetical protein HUW51_08110 [Adhaeribacter swui]|uniref:Probable sensor domain-containing protein n=2 Tax=Adhaeribacter swui TaxID=2086471 RepID=A0A7G7GF36_9BACT|nr:hypothetical protein HUW51_08110 [Adhaeribacter swui]